MDDEVTGRQSEPCSPQPSTSQKTANSDRDGQPEHRYSPTTNREEPSTSSNSSSLMAPLMPFSMPIQQNIKFMKRKTQRDVKRYCSLCRQHGLLEETRGHSCSKRDCECVKCKLMRRRREIMTSQIRLRREQERVMERRFDGDTSPSSHHINQPSTSPKQSPHSSTQITIEEATTAVYACQKCKNHGIMQSKKDHIKDCQFSMCECPLCSLIDSRRKVEICMKECQASGSPTSDGKSPETSRVAWSHSESATNPLLEMLNASSSPNLCSTLQSPLLVPTTFQSIAIPSTSHPPITTVYLPTRDNPLLPTTISSLISSQHQFLSHFTHPLLPINRFLPKDSPAQTFLSISSDNSIPTTTVPLIFPTLSQNLFTNEYQNLLGSALLSLSPNNINVPVTTMGP